jgi:hypothetical protein
VDGTLRMSYWTGDDAYEVLEPEKGDWLIHSVADLHEAAE